METATRTESAHDPLDELFEVLAIPNGGLAALASLAIGRTGTRGYVESPELRKGFHFPSTEQAGLAELLDCLEERTEQARCAVPAARDVDARQRVERQQRSDRTPDGGCEATAQDRLDALEERLARAKALAPVVVGILRQRDLADAERELDLADCEVRLVADAEPAPLDESDSSFAYRLAEHGRVESAWFTRHSEARAARDAAFHRWSQTLTSLHEWCEEQPELAKRLGFGLAV